MRFKKIRVKIFLQAAVESCVNKLVIFKTVPMGEALSTLLTSEWFHPCVDPLVRFKTSLSVKALPTLLQQVNGFSPVWIL